jgi:hypothetical protein
MESSGITLLSLIAYFLYLIPKVFMHLRYLVDLISIMSV